MHGWVNGALRVSFGSSVRPVEPSNNRGAGASIGNQCRRINGFYAFESALHVFPSGTHDRMSLDRQGELHPGRGAVPSRTSSSTATSGGACPLMLKARQGAPIEGEQASRRSSREERTDSSDIGSSVQMGRFSTRPFAPYGKFGGP